MTRKRGVSQQTADRSRSRSGQDRASTTMSRDDETTATQFIDCVAYLIAKRWLREQRDTADLDEICDGDD